MNLKRIIKEVMELREEVNDFNWIDDSDDMRDSEWRQAIFDLEYDIMKKSLYKNQENYIINILKYAKEHPYLSIKDYLKMIENGGK